MLWRSKDGLHVGYVVAEFEDGSTSGPLSVERPGSQPLYLDAAAARLVGWRALCDCRSSASGRFGVEYLREDLRWRGRLIAREPSPRQRSTRPDSPPRPPSRAEGELRMPSKDLELTHRLWLEHTLAPRIAKPDNQRS